MARPNIIVIVADQHRSDCAGYAENPDVRTPNLDALARHGVQFSQAICQIPTCVPSRTSMVTGQYPWTHQMLANEGLPQASTATLPQVLRDAGYSTACIGKAHFSPDSDDHGFATVVTADQYGKGFGRNDYHDWLHERGVTDQVDRWDQVARHEAPQVYWDTFGAMASTLSAPMHSTTWIGNEAIRFIQSADAPFFLWVAFLKPHHPFDPPAPWYRMYEPSRLALLPGVRFPASAEDVREAGYFDFTKLTERAYRRVLGHYYGNISLVDTQVGRILATLISRAHTNNVIVYTSDHGDYMGQHGLLLKDGLRPYDSLIRVPLVISGVEGQKTDTKIDALAELVDLMPTVLDAVGIAVPETVEGRSLTAVVRGESRDLREAGRCAYRGNTRVARTQTHKLIESDEAARKAFYDLESDPHEEKNEYGSAEWADAQALLAQFL